MELWMAAGPSSLTIAPLAARPPAPLLWRLFPAVRPDERERFLFFFKLSALLSLAQTLGLAGSEALFLARVGPSELPFVFVLAPVATVIGCLAYASTVGYVRNDLLFSSLLLATGSALAAAAVMVRFEVSGILHALFCAAYLTQAVLISLHYWTFAADFFDTLQSKRLYPYLVVGASAGGVLGGGGAAAAGSLLSAEAVVFGWSLFLFAAAALLIRNRSDLRRWRTVGSEEKDESSTEGMRGALRFLSRSPLAGWLVVSIVGMISALFLIQYLYMGIFSEAFESAEALAVFLGVYLAISNLIEIFTGTVVTPWLLRRFGVPTANLVHPVLTLLVFPLLWLMPVLGVAVVARAIREMVENAIAAPMRQLSYNALPFRFRGRVRGLLEGVVLFAAMATAGIALLVVGQGVGLFWLCILGFGLGLLYLGASLRVRREYLQSLVTELQHGTLDLKNLDVELGQVALTSLAEQWEDLIFAEREYPSSSLLKLAGDLAERGFGELVLRASQHPHPRVRITCIEALRKFDLQNLATALPPLLRDEDVAVRLAAVRAAIAQQTRPDSVEVELSKCLTDRDPRVRAHAALAARESADNVFRSLLESNDPEQIVAALDCLPQRLAHGVLGLTQHSDQLVRATALTRLASFPDEAAVPVEELLDAMKATDPRVREAGARALSGTTSPRAGEALALALDDSTRAVRSAASKGLARLGSMGITAALPQLQSPRIWTAEAALHAVASAEDVDIRTPLTQAYRTCVVDAWKLYAGIEFAPSESTLAANFLRAALKNAYQRKVWLAIQILSILEDRAVVESVRRTLDRGTSRDRADALEVLSNLADRETSDQFALLLEAGRFTDKLASAAPFLAPPNSLEEMFEDELHADDRWLRIAFAPYVTSSTVYATDYQHEVDLMQRLLALRKVPLFTELSLDRLEVIHQLMHEADYLRGECVVREGDPGDDLFVLIEGELEIYKSHGTPDERLLSTLTPVGYMGEIAILDGSVRSATAIASQDSKLLSLGGEPFKEIVLQTPEISFEIFKVLTARIRAAETRRD